MKIKLLLPNKETKNRQLPSKKRKKN